MTVQFGKYDYQQAKQFLADAELLHAFHSPTYSNALYRKPDGSLWAEYKSHLESPEDDYSLAPKKTIEAAQ